MLASLVHWVIVKNKESVKKYPHRKPWARCKFGPSAAYHRTLIQSGIFVEIAVFPHSLPQLEEQVPD